jgi:hypothetical protein
MCTTNEYKEYLLNPKWNSDMSQYLNTDWAKYSEPRFSVSVVVEDGKISVDTYWINTVVKRSEHGKEMKFNTMAEAGDWLYQIHLEHDLLFSKEALAKRNNWHTCCCCCECSCKKPSLYDYKKD